MGRGASESAQVNQRLIDDVRTILRERKTSTQRGEGSG